MKLGSPHRENTLYFSSIKGNIGHTEATAGVAGLLKVLLMMHHGKIPVQANHSKVNPKIPPLETDRIKIPRSVQPWNFVDRVALVNSYGAAGSNSTVLVRDGPAKSKEALTDDKTTSQSSKYPFFVSAASISSPSRYCQKLAEWLEHAMSESTPEMPAAVQSNLTFNSSDRANHSLPYFVATSVTGIRELEEKLTAVEAGNGVLTAADTKPVILVFGGQESEFIGLSKDIYQSSRLFRKHLDACNVEGISLGFGSIYTSIFQEKPISNLRLCI